MNKDEIKAKISEALSVFNDVNIIDIIKDYVVENYGEEKLILFNNGFRTICTRDACFGHVDLTNNIRIINGIVVVDGRLILHVQDEKRYSCDGTAFIEAILSGDTRKYPEELEQPLGSFITILEIITDNTRFAVWKKKDYFYLGKFIKSYYEDKKMGLIDETESVAYLC